MSVKPAGRSQVSVTSSISARPWVRHLTVKLSLYDVIKYELEEGIRIL